MAAALRSSSTSFRCSFSSSLLSTSSLSSPSSTQLAVSPNQHNSLLRASHTPATAVKASVAHLPLASRRNLSSFKVHAATDETNQPKWWEKTAGPNMVDIHSTQEFLGALSQAGDRLVIVDFYGTWCASCRALFPKLCKIAEEHPEILFLKVNFDENKPMCKSLNVKVLPYFHFYRGADRQVEAFSCSLAKFQKIKDAIATHNTAPQSSDVLVSGQVVTLEDLVQDQSRGSAAT